MHVAHVTRCAASPLPVGCIRLNPRASGRACCCRTCCRHAQSPAQPAAPPRLQSMHSHPARRPAAHRGLRWTVPAWCLGQGQGQSNPHQGMKQGLQPACARPGALAAGACRTSCGTALALLLATASAMHALRRRKRRR